jgi:hypothetical protein
MRLARMRYAADPSSTPDVRLLPVLGAIPKRLLYYREHSKQVTVANKASTTKNITHIYVSKAELLRGMVPECDSLPSIDYCWNREFIDELNEYSKDVAQVSHATFRYAKEMQVVFAALERYYTKLNNSYAVNHLKVINAQIANQPRPLSHLVDICLDRLYGPASPEASETDELTPIEDDLKACLFEEEFQRGFVRHIPGWLMP